MLDRPCSVDDHGGCDLERPAGVGLIDAGASALGFGARGAALASGDDPGALPGGIGDALGGGAVAMTNAIFGPDDSNWFADGDTPQGDKRVETAISSLPGLAIAGGGALAGLMGFGSVDQGLGEGGPTSGARGPNGEANGWAQSAGDWVHEQPGGKEIASAVGTGLLSAIPGVGPMLGGAIPLLDGLGF